MVVQVLLHDTNILIMYAKVTYSMNLYAPKSLTADEVAMCTNKEMII